VIPRNSTTRPLGVEERRRVEEQEEEQDHRKDPAFARPITLATISSSRVGVLCEYFRRFSFSRLGEGELDDGCGHVRLGLRERGGPFGIGLGGGFAIVVVGLSRTRIDHESLPGRALMFARTYPVPRRFLYLAGISMRSVIGGDRKGSVLGAGRLPSG
jgi:hypothetical protein